VYCGYSLGGRLCLRLALDRPDLVRALVLVGASPGIADPAVRAERRAADEALAGRIEHEGVAAFLDRWLAGPLFATLPAQAAGRADRLANTAEGLAYALRRLGTGAQEPLWDRLRALRPPTLLVAGALDGKFAAIAGQMAAAIGPHARVALVQGAGHAVHLERPAELAALMQEFLDAALGSPGRSRRVPVTTATARPSAAGSAPAGAGPSPPGRRPARPVGAGPDQPHRDHGQGQGGQGDQHRRRASPSRATEANMADHHAVNSPRARGRPRRTARVRLPASRSPSMSRTLLASRIATAPRPTVTEATAAAAGTRSSCT
jgi:2-succinyl-6-hydroxy-2,4-cyclohexadiene-1-carboxylate synthase